jgi:multidrug efflux pump subunit AcrA (membrane-fusion protein)
VTSFFSGKIVKIIPEGTFVKEDDPVIWMDTSEFEDQRKEYEVEVELAKASLEQKKESLVLTKTINELSLKSELAKLEFQELKVEDAKINYENQRILVERNLAAKSVEDEARIALLQAELALKQAQIALKKLIEDQASDEKIKKSEVERANVELEREENKLKEVLDKIEKAVLKSNGQGNVSYSVIWKGGKMGKISEGDQIWRRATLMEIPDPATMQALIPISEIDVGKIEVEQKADVKVDAIPDEVFSGTVETKSVVPITDSRPFWAGGGSSGPAGKEFEVRIKLDKPQEKFRQGMTVKATIFINKFDEAIFVPQEAVFNEDDKHYLFVKEDGGHQKRNIKVGPANDNYIIVEEGVEEGEIVLLRNPTKEIERIGELDKIRKRPKSVMKPGS